MGCLATLHSSTVPLRGAPFDKGTPVPKSYAASASALPTFSHFSFGRGFTIIDPRQPLVAFDFFAACAAALPSRSEHIIITPGYGDEWDQDSE